jgi:hypothetical protein
MKYVIDIDGTICISKSGDYKNSAPIEHRIHFINQLYDNGNYIVYFTARGMNSSGGDPLVAKNNWENFTKKQLQNWGAKYHQLILGKPSADFYIDDKFISVENFFRENLE